MTDATPFEYAIRAPMFRDVFDHENHDRELEDWLRNLQTGGGLTSATTWVLYKDDSGTMSIEGTEVLVAELDPWQHAPDYGDHVGWWNCRAVADGAGTVTFRLVNLTGMVEEETWEFDFDSAVSPNCVFNGTWAREDLEDYVHFMLVASVTSGSGTMDVGLRRGNLHALVLSLIGSPPTPPPDDITFDYTGAYEEWTVPALVTELRCVVEGAEGGGAGANGGLIEVTIPVSIGETLQIYVGGIGVVSTGGWPNGGGEIAGSGDSGYGGGGGSSIRRFPYGLDQELVVAGGGGGKQGFNGGGGGGYPAGEAGTWTTGGGSWADYFGGGGGTQSAGGAAGAGTGFPGGDPTPGTRNQGGVGHGAAGGRTGAGGGGGYYGGGGGGAASGIGSGAGGGGSSFYNAAAGVTLVSHTTGTRVGHGTIYIEWG